MFNDPVDRVSHIRPGLHITFHIESVLFVCFHVRFVFLVDPDHVVGSLLEGSIETMSGSGNERIAQTAGADAGLLNAGRNGFP